MVDKIKVSDLIANFIESQGVNTVFGIVGGASLHLLHSIKNTKSINLIHMHHEQSCAFAADGYARVSGTFGVAVSTSGPGATNMVTGICSSYYDSIPVLYLTGQVSTYRQVGDTGCRQIGFQETPINKMFGPITKYCVQISDPLDVLFELQKAVYKMQDGRPGPVVVDIPDDIQRMEVSVEDLRKFLHVSNSSNNCLNYSAELIERVKKSKRPIIIIGAAANKNRVRKKVLEFIEKLDVPVVLTWGACDFFEDNHPLNAGRFGTHGNRHANFAVQNCDLVISLGSRLDTKATGTPISSFARGACKIVVDVDNNELGKFSSFGLKIDFPIHGSIDAFLEVYRNLMVKDDLVSWKQTIQNWKLDFNAFELQVRENSGSSSAYDIIAMLSEKIPQKSNIICDTGCSLAWMMQEFKFKNSQRFFHDFNNTAMGWSLPASIGAHYAEPEKHLVCIVGDGSLMMCLHELSTVSGLAIPLTIILMNNSGYSMIKQTQDQWLSSEYVGSSAAGGLYFPNFELLAKSCNISYKNFECHEKKKFKIFDDLSIESKEVSIFEFMIPENARVLPQVKAGSPNEEMEPMLSAEAFDKNMIVKKNRKIA